MNQLKIQLSNLRQLSEMFDYFILDCDGVVWQGDEVHIGRAFRNIEWLENIGKKVYFVTNSSTKSR